MFSLFVSFRHFLRPYRRRLALALGALALSVLADVARPWPLKLIVDSVLGGHELPGWMPDWLRSGSPDVKIGALVALLIVVVAVGGILTYLGTYWAQSIGQRVVFDIREAVHGHLHRLSLGYHHSQSPGDLAQRLTADVDRIQDVLISGLVNLVTSVLTLGLMLSVMVYVNWRFTLLSLIAAPFLAATVYSYTNRIKWSSREARKQEGRVAGLVQETLGAIHLVQAYTREDHELERFRLEATGSLEAGIQATMLQARFSPTVDFLTALATGIVLWVGAHEVLAGRLTLGLLLVFLSYLNGLYQPMKQLSKLSYLNARGAAAAERLSEIMDTEPALPTISGAYKPARVRGEIAFESVSFTYPLAERPALHDVSFTSAPGQVTALVGRTGAGKSTIASLVPRFYDPTSGTVMVDGVDLREWDLPTLRVNISLVLQDTILFQTSVKENIRYGKPTASDEQIRHAAEQANAHEFIEKLPGGYDTVVGPRGATLSGGQRQRVSIARAMLRDAAILILDEPTTGLDPASEKFVLEALARLMKNRTTLVIAHGEAPVLLADEVLVVDGGRIVERGTARELSKTGAGYRRLRFPTRKP